MKIYDGTRRENLLIRDPECNITSGQTNMVLTRITICIMLKIDHSVSLRFVSIPLHLFHYYKKRSLFFWTLVSETTDPILKIISLVVRYAIFIGWVIYYLFLLNLIMLLILWKAVRITSWDFVCQIQLLIILLQSWKLSTVFFLQINLI